MANAHRPTEPYIVTIKLTRYADVMASSEEAAHRLVARELVRNYGPAARITNVERG